MKSPLVSVIVTTYNNQATLDACLDSVIKQSYQATELIVVDNGSTDDTKTIAKRYTSKVYDRGPERSAQRNFGAQQANGDFLLFIDSDMELDPAVVETCVAQTREHAGVGAVIIPEESFGQGFWAKCKQLERSFYVGVDWMEAARFFGRDAFLEVGGYDTQLLGGEDWDLAHRIGQSHATARAAVYIRHNEGRLSLRRSMKKNFYYAAGYSNSYNDKHKGDAVANKRKSVAARYRLFLSHPAQLIRRPLVGGGMLLMKACELAAGGAGLIRSKVRST